ncbi:glucosamine inositolphosphorylceramide transferase family protein [Maribacter hydrothermalis]|uniref:Glucosamine inositolphosphorylceramide transferase 1 N-terminal domain-containing protein n=1 Tax=Maribacter hydrothermalis TaxID=1836467 RepID=A0A1B7ZCB9_9FLAO|nr:hypothetical protein [Maribacter hydrothermalis]APQ18023.1 hypothetical protein BTR34_12085 [Maribacter hydrothermalis]OBR40564.1 hypothetical protein A9200_15740 [Maribacter hydrothermalis]
MNIGVLINSIEQLDNWQLRVLNQIYQDPRFELILIVKEKLTPNWRLNATVSNTAFCSELSGLAGALLKVQFYIEHNYLFKSTHALSKAKFNRYKQELITYSLRDAEAKGERGYDKNVSNDLKNLRLGLILNLGFASIDNMLFTVSEHGVWELLFKDVGLQKNGPVGFWEVLKKKQSIGATLLHTCVNPAENEVLATAFFNRHWSMTETATMVSEGSVSLLFKHLNRLDRGELKIANLYVDNPNYDKPTLLNVLAYLVLFYSEFLNKLIEKFRAKFFKRRYECWTIFTGKSGFFEDITSAAVPLKMPNDEFWADPFLFHHNEKDYLFFENYSYKTKRGKISCGILHNNELTQVIDVLDFTFHLSFPFIFEEDGDIFLMPEGSENKKLEVFKAVDFPSKWELYTTAFEGEVVGDAFFHVDDDRQKWLFLNKQAAKTAPMNSELFIYKVDAYKMNVLTPHKQNPVIIDARVARNGGAIFKHNNQLYRPSQRNVDGVYGRSLNINKIEKLTLEEYKETTVQIIEPSFDKRLIGLHHLHQHNGTFVFDAAYRSKR